ncbi:ATP/GTP-binding protein [Streptomyces sp. NPDC048182]|uniref:AAA family ATPase n=1 Tax=Streptomyces sp. NPDC048182 TaxID=3365507 RepID=UPI003721E924
MLLSFRVSNHRSIREEQQLNLNPVYEDDRPVGTDWAAVPVAGIFGANASGKTNLLDALQYMAHMVVSSHRDAEPDGGISRHPFLLDDAARDEPSWYIADLLLDGVRYTYGFAVDDTRVTEEWLDSYPMGKKRQLFSRGDDRVKPGASQDTRELELVESITEPNVLFLSLAARSRQRDFRPVYDWFAHHLQFRRANDTRSYALSAMRALEDADRYPEIMLLLRAADLGIEGCGTERLVMDEETLRRQYGSRRIPSRLLRELEDEGPRELLRPWVGHRGRNGMVQLDLHDESAGTQALLQQAPRFLSVLRRGGTFVVDEIDASLHSVLTARLIGLFQQPETNPNGAQLLFTSHDPSLLGRRDGEDILKRDQVWFVEKDSFGESSLYSLADFKPRKDENRERRYLGGSYGGVPFIDESFTEALLRRGGGATGQDTEAQRQARTGTDSETASSRH